MACLNVRVEICLTFDEYLKILETMNRLGFRSIKDLLLYAVKVSEI